MLQALTVGKGRIPRDDLCLQHANFTYTAPNQNQLPNVFAIGHTCHCTTASHAVTLLSVSAERGGTSARIHPQRVPAEEDEGKTTPAGPQQQLPGAGSL